MTAYMYASAHVCECTATKDSDSEWSSMPRSLQISPMTAQALVDIPIVMNSMPPAIKLAVVQSRN